MPLPADIPDAALLAHPRKAGNDRDRMASVLLPIARQQRRIRELLDLVDRLAPTRPRGLVAALRLLGPQAVPSARVWAADRDHHCSRTPNMRYDRARKSLDRHPHYILAAFSASGTQPTETHDSGRCAHSPCSRISDS